MVQNKSFLGQLALRIKRNRLGELLVQNGKLTPEQLQALLKEQNKTGNSLGELACNQGLITKFDIRKSLFEQTAYRTIATCLTLFIGMSAIGASSASAKSQFAQTSMIHKAAYGGQNHLNALKQAPSQKLFGTREVASKDISAFKKWTGILSRLDKISFNDSKLQQFEGMSLSSKVVAVNEYVNKFRYIEDKNNFGKSDYWATPTEFFARGGDCEDFAIAKYALLKESGVPESKMRLAIVQDKIKNIPHAVLIVYTDNGPMLLDNQMKTTKQVASVDRYKPIYSINASGWWRHLS